MALATLVGLGALSGCGPAAGTSAPAPSSPAVISATPTPAPVPGPSSSTTSGGSGPGASGSGGSTTRALGQITVTRTGGMAGVMEQLVIVPDGLWQFTNRRTGAVQRGRLTAAQAGRLAQLAADPALVAESRISPPAVACADSFVYTIAIGELSLHYDQCSAQGRRPATDRLVAALLEATPL